MRFACAVLSFLVMSSAGLSSASAETRPHQLKLPQSYNTFIKAQDKTRFTVSQPQPLIQTPAKAASNSPVAPIVEAVGTVHQGFYPVSEASSEGLNFTGMARQLPDAIHSAALNDTAGMMSWTTKFN